MASKKNDMTRSQLSEAAKEIQDQLGLTEDDGVTPAINPKAKKDELQQKLIEAGSAIDPQEDELSDKTWNVLEKLGAAHRPAQEYVPQRDEGGEEAVPENPDAVNEREPQEQEEDQPEEDDQEETPEQDEEEQAEESQEEEVATKANYRPEVENEDVHVENEKQGEQSTKPAKSSEKKEQKPKVIKSQIDPKIKKNENDKVKLFIEEIKAAPRTMAEIKKMDWNEKGASFNAPLRVLLEKGLMKKDGKQIIWAGDEDYNIRREGKKIVY